MATSEAAAGILQKVGDYLGDLRQINSVHFDIPAGALEITTDDGAFVLTLAELPDRYAR